VYKIKEYKLGHISTDHKIEFVSHKEYAFHEDVYNDYLPLKGTLYAFGVMINPLNTNVIALDFDNTSSYHRNNIDIFLCYLMSKPEVVDIDLKISSRSGIRLTSYHIIIGLDKEYNIKEFLERIKISKIDGLCLGYIQNVLDTNVMIIRTSQKFQNIKTKPTFTSFEFGFRKIDGIYYKATKNDYITEQIKEHTDLNEDRPRRILKLR
jgi:hypothetical protein